MKIHFWFCQVGMVWIQIPVSGLAFSVHLLEIMLLRCKILFFCVTCISSSFIAAAFGCKSGCKLWVMRNGVENSIDD